MRFGTGLALALGIAAGACAKEVPPAAESEAAPASEVVQTEEAPGAAAAPVAGEPIVASAAMADTAGNALGTLTLTETAHGILVAGTLTSLPEGTHAFHIHTVGACEPPFDSAGGHFNPVGAHHGFVTEGPHAGDMTNLHVPAGGSVTFEVIAPLATVSPSVSSVMDADGSALVVHASADDYATDPSGNAGARIACGVIK